MVYGTLILALKKQGDVGKLTEAGIQMRRPCRVVGSEDRRRRSMELGNGLLWWSSGRLDPTARVLVVLRSGTEGQGELWSSGGEQSW